MKNAAALIDPPPLSVCPAERAAADGQTGWTCGSRLTVAPAGLPFHFIDKGHSGAQTQISELRRMKFSQLFRFLVTLF